MLFRNSIILLLFCFLFFSCKKKHVTPGVYINEILSSNNSDIADPLSHKQVDCIELFNGFDYPVDISGYYLTNKYNKPSKWKIPKKTRLAPYEHFLIWADKLDTLNHTNFKLNSSGGCLLLFSEEKIIIDKVNYFQQSINVSYGRIHDASDNWAYYDEPTMGSSNDNKIATRNLIHSSKPIFSINGGMYENKQTIELSSKIEKCKIRYTLNGNRPNRNSLLYKTPIKINKTSVIRAVAIEEGKLISEILTNTYFINLSKKGPVISIVADENALWNSENGIYSNSLQRIKRLANLEFFEDSKQVINQKVDMKISGNIAKYFDQKAIVLEANDKYGESTLKHQFFKDSRLHEYPSILLRAGGHPDKYSSMFRDGFALKLLDNYINIDHPNYRPAIVYLNGKYWGMYNIREKTNSSFIGNNHNLATNKFDYLQNCWLDINNGDDEDFKKLHDYIKQCDKSNPLNYQYVKELIDIDNYICNVEKCSKCNKGELIPVDSDGIMICNECFSNFPYLIENEKSSYKEPPKEACFYAYKRINHFREILAQFQAKETTQIPEQIFEDIKNQIKKERISVEQLTNKKAKDILKKLGYNKFYEHIPFIKHKLGIKPPVMTQQLEEVLCNLFMDIQGPYAKYCPDDRVNFLNYYCTIYKLCELLDQKQFLPYFPMLKDREKRIEQDNIWKKICAELDWAFIPTL